MGRRHSRRARLSNRSPRRLRPAARRPLQLCRFDASPRQNAAYRVTSKRVHHRPGREQTARRDAVGRIGTTRAVSLFNLHDGPACRQGQRRRRLGRKCGAPDNCSPASLGGKGGGVQRTRRGDRGDGVGPGRTLRTRALALAALDADAVLGVLPDRTPGGKHRAGRILPQRQGSFVARPRNASGVVIDGHVDPHPLAGLDREPAAGTNDEEILVGLALNLILAAFWMRRHENLIPVTPVLGVGRPGKAQSDGDKKGEETECGRVDRHGAWTK